MKQGQAKVLTEDELKRVYAAAGAGKFGLRNICLIDFSFKLGLRAKEMTALMIDDLVDGKGKIVDDFHLKVDQTKGDTGRRIFLKNPTLRKNLARYLATRTGDLNRRLFKSQKDAFSGNTMQMLFARFYKAAGITGAKSHSGRRTFATNLIERGYDIKSVSLLMGHANIQTTARYIQGNPIALARMVEDL